MPKLKEDEVKARPAISHIRIPLEVHEALRRAAESEETSMNRVIVRYCRRGLAGDGIPIKRAKGNAPRVRPLGASV